jgi:hypothetical protein
MKPITGSQTLQRSYLEGRLKSAVVLGWDELMPDSTSGLIHVEYQAADEGSLDFLKIWASTIRGQWKLICEFWMRPLWSHSAGVRFGSEYHSVDFARTLELVLGPADAFSLAPNLRGLVQVSPPTEEERDKAKQLTLSALEHHASMPFDEHVAA